MRSQLSSIRDLLEKNGMASPSSAAAAGDVDTARSQSVSTASNPEVISLQNAPKAINEQMIPASQPATAAMVPEDVSAEHMPASERKTET